MNSHNGATREGSPLDNIIEEYAASSPGPSYDLLARWVKLYPQYERELTEFTVNWTVAAPTSPFRRYSTGRSRPARRSSRPSRGWSPLPERGASLARSWPALST
jgi:hypothetical protein